MRIRKSLLVLLSVCLINGAYAVPSALMYQGKPIDSLCFFDMESESNTIQLKNCGVAKQKLQTQEGNADLIKQGFIGYNLIGDGQPQGSTYYKAFDAGNNQFWIYGINNGGGSGDFTTISLVKRTSDTTLSVKTIASGDRCNGGIVDPQAKNHHLNFAVSMTAFDILELSGQNPHKLKAYDDLAACAVCCAANAHYDLDNQSKLTLQYVELNDVNDPKEMSDQGKYQACFNNLFATYVSKGQRKLDQAQLQQFAKAFNESCVK